MTINVEVSATSTRRLLILMTTAFGLATTSVAFAALTSFQDGDQLEAGKLNGNFTELEAKIVVLEEKSERPTITVVGGKYSLGAVYRGATDQTTKGKIVAKTKTGYEAAKVLCEDRLLSSSAHMCTSEELVRSRQLGIKLLVEGWYSSGGFGEDVTSGAVTYGDGKTVYVADCEGWAVDTSDYSGQALRINQKTGVGATIPLVPSIGSCSGDRPVLCCD